LECGSEAVTERPERTAQGYRRFRCRACGKQFNERSDTLLNRTQYPSDVIALVVLWRLRYKLSLRDLSEMFLIHRDHCLRDPLMSFVTIRPGPRISSSAFEVTRSCAPSSLRGFRQRW
jgi:hypothetical protein